MNVLSVSLISLCYSSVHQKKSEPESSCVSMRSDESLHHPVNFKSHDTRFNLKYYIYFFVKDMIIVRYFKLNCHN